MDLGYYLFHFWINLGLDFLGLFFGKDWAGYIVFVGICALIAAGYTWWSYLKSDLLYWNFQETFEKFALYWVTTALLLMLAGFVLFVVISMFPLVVFAIIVYYTTRVIRGERRKKKVRYLIEFLFDEFKDRVGFCN